MLTLAYEHFFLYDNENVTTETFVTELNQQISAFSFVSFSCETKVNSKLDLITPIAKLKFNMKNDVFKNQISLNLGKVHTKISFNTTRDNVLNLGLLCTRKNETVGEKRTMKEEIIKTIHASGLKKCVNYERMLDWNAMNV